MVKYEDYKDELKKLYPNFSDEFLKEYFELRVEYWK
jgi:hypothetical protein